MFKNMKIEINEQQPLDEVVKELKRLGITYSGSGFDKDAGWVGVARTFSGWQWETTSDSYKVHMFDASLTTLAELKDMPLNDFGFDFKQQPSNTVELGMQMLEEGVK